VTYADNVPLSAFAHRPPPVSSRSVSPACRAHSNKPVAAVCGGRIGRTDGRTPDRCRPCSAFYAGSANNLPSTTGPSVRSSVPWLISILRIQCRINPSEARSNYLPKDPYLRETKTYLNCNSLMQCMGTSNMYDYQHNTTISVQFSSSLSQLQWHVTV